MRSEGTWIVDVKQCLNADASLTRGQARFYDIFLIIDKTLAGRFSSVHVIRNAMFRIHSCIFAGIPVQEVWLFPEIHMTIEFSRINIMGFLCDDVIGFFC